MPFYHQLGEIPPKRHTQFKKPKGGFYYEQLFGTIGFDGMYTNSYHVQRPTQVKEIKKSVQRCAKNSQSVITCNRIDFRGFQVASGK
jgi:homogentisate 1,2-dioxygenase